MNEPNIQLPSVTVTVTQHRSVPGLLGVGGEPPPLSAEATVEVTVTGPDHAAVLLNAAAFGADQALLSTDPTHPAHTTSSAQCGRTFVHGRHETTEGTCYGLDGTEVPEPDLFNEAETEVRAPVTVVLPAGTDLRSVKVENLPPDGRGVLLLQVAGEVTEDAARLHLLQSGLGLIASRGCETTTLGDCWGNGRTVDAPFMAERACYPCVARRVLDGLPLPSKDDPIRPKGKRARR